MKREEERSNAAEQYVEGFHSAIKRMCKECFVDGAKWADENPRKGLVDIEKACEYLEENKDHPFIGCEDPCLSGYLTDEFIGEFKKAMEE